MNITAYALAERFTGLREVAGATSNPAILAMLKLDGDWPEDDAVPWCSAFTNYICWLLDLPRSKSLAARSWLTIGTPVEVPVIGFDVVILQRGLGHQPGPEVTQGASGHVGFYAGGLADTVHVLGGNQDDSVSVARFDASRVLGYRRLYGVT